MGVNDTCILFWHVLILQDCHQGASCEIDEVYISSYNSGGFKISLPFLFAAYITVLHRWIFSALVL